VSFERGSGASECATVGTDTLTTMDIRRHLTLTGVRFVRPTASPTTVAACATTNTAFMVVAEAVIEAVENRKMLLVEETAVTTAEDLFIDLVTEPSQEVVAVINKSMEPDIWVLTKISGEVVAANQIQIHHLRHLPQVWMLQQSFQNWKQRQR